MLTYAFQVLKQKNYRKIETEEFKNTEDLFAEILKLGLTSQFKRGLEKEYITHNERSSTIRGKINITQSLKQNTLQRRQLICTYDDLSINTYKNQIIKSTLLALINKDINKSRKKEIKNLLLNLEEVNTIDIYRINWNIQYNSNNQTYTMLIAICELTIKGLLQTQNEGSTKIMDYKEGKLMSHLYEKFIFNYYKKEHPELKVNAIQIKWAGTTEEDYDNLLPLMQTDITLQKDNRILIIDAKYYHHKITNTWNEHRTVKSAHLYQIFAYVKNMDANTNHNNIISGMLLYAKTDREELLNTYNLSGNKITVRTLNLNVEFNKIKEQLDSIAYEYFNYIKFGNEITLIA